ncbi:DUF2059 domain-containing protein [Pseudoxanthomonas sp.]|uniref:DUF2059 domain-containing protein n=1 Tax=Pseudoxanthomonas sp. TaxID=1871049 RepID=UPI0026250776|nr:DUF2059 domain-containing protein [Pseudoxanthomonas sp.]WDS34783.1 MAG: DUF2059 domain-containing protein [Pseudoxanthomonas sp.]
MSRCRFAPVLLLLSAMAAIAPALAREPTDQEIERLLTASRAQSMLAAIQPQVEAMQREQFAQLTQGKTLTAEQQAEIQQIQARTSQIVRQSLAWDSMRPVYLDVYRKTFDDDDVKSMTKFYESKAGQHLLDRTPVMMQTLMVGIQQKMIPQLEALQAEVKTVSAEPIPAPPVSPPEARRKAAAPTSTKKKATAKKATTTKKASTTKKAPAKKSTTTTKKKT